MKKSTFQAVVILMGISLLGITIIQFVWLKRSIELKETIFNDKVTLALSAVKKKLEDDVNNIETFNNYSKNRTSTLFKIDGETLPNLLNPNFRNSDIFKSQLGSTAGFIRPDIALNQISPLDLDTYLKEALKDQDIKLEYNYGVFSEDIQDFIITDGKYNINAGNTEQSSQGNDEKNLNRSTQKIDLFSSADGMVAGSLRLFFPNKTAFFISSILPQLISSIVFTGLIMFCFIYTIMTILKQKKISMMKTDFINNMTHEFKTPIATISLAADSIDSPMIRSKPEQIARYANIIRQENTRMLEQVEKVLQIARLDKQDFELKITEIDLNDLVNRAVEHTALKVNDRGGVIKAILGAKNPSIRGDENHISNVIHNLLDNANKYSRESPNISLETVDTKDGVLLSISDKGIGMTKDQLKRIFEKFYRVSTGNLHDVKGFGLGLSYVKAIVDAHRGKISVKSEVGKGSTFELFFPYTNVAAA